MPSDQYSTYSADALSNTEVQPPSARGRRVARKPGRIVLERRQLAPAPPRANFFKRDLMSNEKLPERGAAARDPSLAHRDQHLVQRQIRLLRDQSE
jgi:hypothetical protein